MSGPKTSRYTLTAEQKRILAEQRKRERRKAAAKESIKRNSQKMLQISSVLSKESPATDELVSRCGDDGGLNTKKKELSDLTAVMSSIIAKANNNDAGSLESVVKKTSDCLLKAEQLKKEISAIEENNEIKLQTILNKDIDKGFSYSFADIKKTKQNIVYDEKKKMKKQLKELKNETALPMDMQKEIIDCIEETKLINDAAFLKNFTALKVMPLLKKCSAYLKEYESCHKEFERLYSEYNAVCGLYYYTAQEYGCSAESIEKLKNEIKRIKEAADYSDEQSYISGCIDEVMKEMGYSVLGSREVTKKNGRHFRNELYTYGEGTAVNVTYSSDGKISMELGGLDKTDRLPDNHETSALCKSMNQFCGDFKEIEERLLSKGVILADRISLLPPNEEYAQIINTNDYEMVSEADNFEVKKQHKKAAKQKAMRME